MMTLLAEVTMEPDATWGQVIVLFFAIIGFIVVFNKVSEWRQK